MRALVFDQSLALDTRRPDPPTSDGDTLIKVRQAGICATDIEITKGYMSYRGVLGHEFVGEVVSSSEREFIGQRVCGKTTTVGGDAIWVFPVSTRPGALGRCWEF